MVDVEELYKRLDEIKEAIRYLEKTDSKDLEDKDKFLLSRYQLQIILEAIFTIGNQIIANKVFRKPSNYRDILTVLYENKVISKDICSGLIPFVDLRNRLVHTYWKISKEALLGIIEKDLNIFRNFVKSILKSL